MHRPFNELVASQFLASLSMLAQCIDKCPDEHWDGVAPNVVGKYPFCMVAYHVLCFADCYLSPSNERFKAEIAERAVSEGGGFHPAGMAELEEEYPSRRMERLELRRYVAFCAEKARRSIEAETEQSLAGPSGFTWIPLSRAEGHLYNLRHVAHHTGQLTAFLARMGVETRWVKAGWKAPG